MTNFRWEPFRDLLALNRVFDARTSPFRGEESLTGTTIPPVDIHETENAVVVQADLPGMKKEDLDIRVENNTLVFRGERKQATEVKEDDYHRVERVYGSFARSFTLPSTVDPEKVSASYEDGVLRIMLGKREESKPKQIKVQVNGAVAVEAPRKQAA